MTVMSCDVTCTVSAVVLYRLLSGMKITSIDDAKKVSVSVHCMCIIDIRM